MCSQILSKNTVGETVAEMRVVPCRSNATVTRRVEEVEGNSSGWWLGSVAQPSSCTPPTYTPGCVAQQWETLRGSVSQGASIPPLETAPNCYQWPNYGEKHRQKNRDSYKTCQIWNCYFCRWQNSQTSVMTFGFTWFEPPGKIDT